MPKLKLDHFNVTAAQCPPGRKRLDLWDTQITGFVLEVRPSGGKTFYLRYSDKHERQRQYKICAFGDMSVEKVRKEAQRLRSEVVLGRDPAEAKEETRAILTYAELATMHLNEARTYQRAFSTTEMYMRRHILPRWGKVRLSEVHQRDVAQWLAEKAGEGLAPATVEKIRVIFGRSFELALRWSMPGVTRNPTRSIKRPPIQNARERFLTKEEAKRLLDAVDRSPNPQLWAIVRLLLLTGARRGELLNAKWEHVDLERRVWLIPTSKTGKPRRVPLSNAAVQVLEALVRYPGCPYVVPNPDTLKPFVSLKHGWDTARREAKLGDLRLHDLRHSAASFMINAGVDLFAVGRVLGHADHKSTMRYSHLANETLMAAVEKGASGFM